MGKRCKSRYIQYAIEILQITFPSSSALTCNVENSTRAVKSFLKRKITDIDPQALSKMLRVTHEEFLRPCLKRQEIINHRCNSSERDGDKYLPRAFWVSQCSCSIVNHLSNLTNHGRNFHRKVQWPKEANRDFTRVARSRGTSHFKQITLALFVRPGSYHRADNRPCRRSA